MASIAVRLALHFCFLGKKARVRTVTFLEVCVGAIEFEVDIFAAILQATAMLDHFLQGHAGLPCSANGAFIPRSVAKFITLDNCQYLNANGYQR